MSATAIATLGRSVRQRSSSYASRLRFLGAVARASVRYPSSAYPVLARTLVNQIRFTAVQALPFVLAIALLIGLTVLVETMAQAARLGLTATLGRILVTVVIRELGPMLTAIIVIARSGTAIAAELATSDVMGEVEAAEAMGVDPYQYWVLPRMLGTAVSVTLLIVYFDVVTVLSGLTLGDALGRVDLASSLAVFRAELSPADLWLTLAKGTLFGLGIALLCCYEGLRAGGRPTLVPICVTRGVVASLGFVFALSALFSALRFLL